MKVLLISVGTRGDMEPMLALGQIVQEHGHQVICAFPDQFGVLAEEAGLGFASLGEKYIQLLDSDAGKKAMGGGGSGLERFAATLKLARNQTDANKQLVQRQYEIVQSERPARIVYNGKATYPVLWEVGHPGKTTLISPVPYMHYVRDHAHVAFNRNLGRFLNRQTYALANFGLVTTVRMSASWLGLGRKVTRKEINRALRTGKVIYTISPALFPRPDYWPEHMQVLGYHQRPKSVSWRPDEALASFLARHRDDRLLFITFGSMSNPRPAETTRIIVDILQRNNIPALINTAAGGLVRPDEYDPQLLHFVSQIPYDWILPRVYGAIHHGGSGTTHLALKYGCASLIVPHIIDQFVWDSIIAELGAGPTGVKIGKLSTRDLEPKILDLLRNRAYKERAGQLANEMAGEEFRDAVYRKMVTE
jgi:UDP:flavonoid glycosyltransferase YjiC (YdhE family)